MGGKQGRALRTPAFPREPISASKPRSSSKVHTLQAPDTSEPTTSLSASLSLSLSLSLCLSSALLPWLKVVGKNQTSRGWGPRRDLSVPYFGLGPNWGELFPTISQQALFLVCLFFLHTTRVLHENIPFIPLIKCHEDWTRLVFFVFLYVFSRTEKSSLLLRPAKQFTILKRGTSRPELVCTIPGVRLS